MPKDKQLLGQRSRNEVPTRSPYRINSHSESIISGTDIDQTLIKLANDIVSNHSLVQAKDSLVLIGIHRRGVPLAKRLKALIEKKIKRTLPLGTLDITLYRDDLDTVGHLPIVKNTDIPCDLTDKSVVLVDDVLFTGRTIRSALNELAEFGRTRRIQLAVLIDRGHRELPICADYVGKSVQTRPDEIVMVRLKETDGIDEVVITVKSKQKAAKV